MELERGHPTVRLLRQMAPNLLVAGGSFGHWLPYPSAIPPRLRLAAFSEAQQAAVRRCLEDLGEGAGDASVKPVRPASGGPVRWADGTIGSMTHKGTVVLGVLTSVENIRAIGIDLELVDVGDLSRVASLVAPEGIPDGCGQKLGSVLSFSAKEAAFKAFFSLRQEALGFADIALDWTRQHGERISARAQCPRALCFTVECRLVQSWLLSVAVLPSETQQPS